MMWPIAVATVPGRAFAVKPKGADDGLLAEDRVFDIIAVGRIAEVDRQLILAGRQLGRVAYQHGGAVPRIQGIAQDKLAGVAGSAKDGDFHRVCPLN